MDEVPGGVCKDVPNHVAIIMMATGVGLKRDICLPQQVIGPAQKK